MAVALISSEQARAAAVASLGLPAGTSISSHTVLVAAVRRAAAAMAPATPRALRSAVIRAFSPLMDEDREVIADGTRQALDDVVAYGDLIEAPGEHDERMRLLYLSAPSFIENADGRLFLVGLLPGDPLVVPEALRSSLQCEGHVRFLKGDTPTLKATLAEAGILEIRLQQWLNAPPAEPAADVLGRFDTALAARGRAGHLEGLQILDPGRSVHYYRGRWTNARRKTGRYVARRPHAYGADQWCYLELSDGIPVRLLDLEPDDASRACDVAWRLQAAIDATAGHPQEIRLARERGGTRMDVFSPVPRWLQRRWDLLARPATAAGALFSYCVTDLVADQEAHYVNATMWMAVQDERGRHAS